MEKDEDSMPVDKGWWKEDDPRYTDAEWTISFGHAVSDERKPDAAVDESSPPTKRSRIVDGTKTSGIVAFQMIGLDDTPGLREALHKQTQERREREQAERRRADEEKPCGTEPNAEQQTG